MVTLFSKLFFYCVVFYLSGSLCFNPTIPEDELEWDVHPQGSVVPRCSFIKCEVPRLDAVFGVERCHYGIYGLLFFCSFACCYGPYVRVFGQNYVM